MRPECEYVGNAMTFSDSGAHLAIAYSKSCKKVGSHTALVHGPSVSAKDCSTISGRSWNCLLPDPVSSIARAPASTTYLFDHPHFANGAISMYRRLFCWPVLFGD